MLTRKPSDGTFESSRVWAGTCGVRHEAAAHNREIELARWRSGRQACQRLEIASVLAVAASAVPACCMPSPHPAVKHQRPHVHRATPAAVLEPRGEARI